MKFETKKTWRRDCTTKSFPEDSQIEHSTAAGDGSQKCVVEEKFIKYYFLLLFLICFLTPVLITISLNFFISLAVQILISHIYLMIRVFPFLLDANNFI